MFQELIEAEAAEAIGAGLYERSDTRTNERNGHRPRTLSTKAGDLHLNIPKLRRGSFFPSILEPRRRIDQALYAVVMEAYVLGVSTRSVDDLVQALGIDSGVSKSEVSRIRAGLDELVTAFRVAFHLLMPTSPARSRCQESVVLRRKLKQSPEADAARELEEAAGVPRLGSDGGPE